MLAAHSNAVVRQARKQPAHLRHERRSKAHVLLLVILGCFLLFALSNKVYIGSHLIVELPLSERVERALGTFRSSGRFFWPIGYALVAGSIVLILRHFRPVLSSVLLLAALILQLVDTAPLRAAISATTDRAAPSVINRQQMAALIERSNAVMIFPSFDCTEQDRSVDAISQSQKSLLLQANMEIELFAARRNLPINSVYNARLRTDCRSEDAVKHQPLKRGTLYVYLTPYTLDPGQLGEEACAPFDSFRYCLVPAN